MAALLLLGVVTTRSGWVRMVPEPLLPASVRDADELVRPDDELAFLVGLVGPDEVVVGAHAGDNRVIPALAGRTLALVVPRPFVTDADAREQAEREYLDPSLDAARRREIEERYDVRFVLLRPQHRQDRALLEVLAASGATVVHRDDGIVLLELPTPR